MLTKWIRGLLGGKSPRASIVCRSAVIYRENGRKMTIAGEMLPDGFEIYVASIVAWDDNTGELIDASDRQRIIQKVKRSLESQGARVVLN